MGNGTSIGKFNGLTTAGGGLLFDVGALLRNTGSLSRDSGRAMRHQVQLAAEQAFPWRNSGVASIRKTFLLPTDRPMPG